MIRDCTTTDPNVAKSLNLIEEDLSKSVRSVLADINVVFAGNPTDTGQLDKLAAVLHDLLVDINYNRGERRHLTTI